MEKIIKTKPRMTEAERVEFDQEMENCLAAADCDSLIIDMADTKYISSACLRVVQKAIKKTRAKGCSLIFKNVQPMVLEIFEITGFAGNIIIEEGNN